ncbi:glycosyltransferase [Microcoleus sp.]|uniref:glycosyltransferase n=1 Tax=Microcoleus sp. TaxID=44472 RepID=UPI00403ED725
MINSQRPKTKDQLPITNYQSNRNRENRTVSIIIPSYNRSSSLRRGLDALHSQTYPLELIEVIVVADKLSRI